MVYKYIYIYTYVLCGIQYMMLLLSGCQALDKGDWFAGCCVHVTFGAPIKPRHCYNGSVKDYQQAYRRACRQGVTR